MVERAGVESTRPRKNGARRRRFLARPTTIFVHRSFDRQEEARMRYICILYGEPERVEALSGVEWDALGAESRAYLDELRQGGHLIAAERLQPVETAMSLRVRNGTVSITDGPFVETEEQLGGFILIEARDLNEAIQLAGRLPPASPGGVEVRPV
jgi:hypothetical protein